MAEATHRFHSVEGYPLNTQRVSLAAYRILCHFFSSKQIGDICDDEIDCPFSGLRDDHEKSEIVHLLIEIATFIRVAQDSLRHNDPEVAPSISATSVGVLTHDEKPKERKSLSLREACNKIIHAEDITFDVLRQRRWFQRYLAPKVFLYGSQGRRKWRATVDIQKFVGEVYHLCRIT